MTAFSVDFINPFLTAATKIISEMCMIDIKIGKPVLKEPIFSNNCVVIMIGVTGEMKGQVMFALGFDAARDIASKMMMGMPVNELDELARSAISELGNMILGTAATIFSNNGVAIDITPPTLGLGTMSFSQSYAKNICIPLEYNGYGAIEINIAMKQD